MSLALQRVIILDRTPLSRERITSTLVSRGIEKNNIFSIHYVSDAQKILSDYDVSLIFIDHSEFSQDLVNMITLLKSTARFIDPFIVMLSTTTSRDEILYAAQNGVHYFIPKPFTQVKLTQCLNYYQEYHLDPYEQLIRKARYKLGEMEISEAEELLARALPYRDPPLEAIYLSGKCCEKKENFLQAIEQYKTCLEIDEWHHDSLVALLGGYTQQGLFVKAFGVGKSIVMRYPANHDAVSQVIRLAVMLKAFESVAVFHEAIKKEVPKNLTLMNYMGAGLFIGGKYFLTEGRTQEALHCFDVLVSSCAKFTKFLRNVIFLLVEFGLNDEAQIYFESFPELEENETLVLRFALGLKDVSNAAEIQAEFALLEGNPYASELNRVIEKRITELT
jgi:tetratricopeptide (TPR) repeat protein